MGEVSQFEAPFYFCVVVTKLAHAFVVVCVRLFARARVDN